MRRPDKISVELEASEARLRSDLLRVLPGVAENGAALFTNSAFNPHRLLQAHLPADSESLFRAAHTCVALRERLGLSVAGSVGGLFIAACREAANLADEHRRGPRKLAEWLLNELGAST